MQKVYQYNQFRNIPSCIIILFITISIFGCKHNDNNTADNSQNPVQNKIEIRGIGIGSGLTWTPVYEGGIVEADFEFINDGSDYSGNWFNHSAKLYKKSGSDFIEVPQTLSGIEITPVSTVIAGLKWKNGERRLWIFDRLRVQDSGRYKYKVTLSTPIGAIESDASNNSIEYEFDVIKYPSSSG